MTVDNHLDDSRTSAFTLPSPREEHQHQSPSGPKTPLHPFDSYEEFPCNRQSPSLPWLVEYWSSSLCRAPSSVFDNLCSCSSAVESPVVSIDRDSSKSSHSKTNTYFDDTILRSDPKVDRSPTKISPSRWEALRAVVASHGDYTIQDYCDLYEPMPCHEEKEETSDENSKYPTKTRKKSCRQKFRQSSILADDSKDDDMEDGMNHSQDDDDDDIRMEAPASPPADSESPPFQDSLYACHTGSQSERMLNTCHSFDQYIDTTRNCACTPENPSTPPTATPPLSPPSRTQPTRFHDRRRNRQIASSLAPRTLNFQRQTPPSPSPSAADTYTTISLSQSFAREFEEDESEVRTPERPAFPQNMEEGSLFLERLASETVPTTTSPSRSPFRRLLPRTTMSENNGHEDEKKEDSEDTENKSPRITSRTTRKRASDEEDDDHAYRFLVRMSPDNYKHGKSMSASKDEDWYYGGASVDEFKEDLVSETSSSVLLPLHPHQRIIAPFPHDLDQDDTDHSGYTSFRRLSQRTTSPAVPNF